MFTWTLELQGAESSKMPIFLSIAGGICLFGISELCSQQWRLFAVHVTGLEDAGAIPDLEMGP